MSRYIDADKLKQELDEWAINLCKPTNLVRDDTFVIIDEQPTADVVEVVRCKDCRHYVNSEHYGMMCEILVHAEQGDNFYCGYGQKKLEQEKWDV